MSISGCKDKIICADRTSMARLATLRGVLTLFSNKHVAANHQYVQNGKMPAMRSSAGSGLTPATMKSSSLFVFCFHQVLVSEANCDDQLPS
jgi:hypothetical protein